ncbi:hypothetical protein Dimus_031113 [Dionaea muscipula]
MEAQWAQAAGPTLSSNIHASVKQVVDSSFVLWKESVASYDPSSHVCCQPPSSFATSGLILVAKSTPKSILFSISKSAADCLRNFGAAIVMAIYMWLNGIFLALTLSSHPGVQRLVPQFLCWCSEEMESSFILLFLRLESLEWWTFELFVLLSGLCSLHLPYNYGGNAIPYGIGAAASLFVDVTRLAQLHNGVALKVHANQISAPAQESDELTQGKKPTRCCLAVIAVVLVIQQLAGAATTCVDRGCSWLDMAALICSLCAFSLFGISMVRLLGGHERLRGKGLCMYCSTDSFYLPFLHLLLIGINRPRPQRQSMQRLTQSYYLP